MTTFTKPDPLIKVGNFIRCKNGYVVGPLLRTGAGFLYATQYSDPRDVLQGVVHLVPSELRWDDQGVAVLAPPDIWHDGGLEAPEWVATSRKAWAEGELESWDFKEVVK